MFKLGQSSFRRILLSRILLLSVPVLVIGEVVAFNKARSSLLETAQWNLTDSAVKKGESIINAIAALKSNLLMASQTSVLQTGTAKEAQQFLTQLARQLPTHIQCVQLTNLANRQIVASTCGNKHISSAQEYYGWSKQKTTQNSDRIYIKPVITSQTQQAEQLKLLLCVPVYNSAGQLRYALSIQSALHQQQSKQPGLLAGSTVVIDDNGRILAHPLVERVGRNIQQEADAARLKIIVDNAIAGRKSFLYLSFAKNGEELLAGYNVIASPITKQPGQNWIILAVTPLNNALFGLQEIKLILAVLTFGLLVASLLATLYVARDLARPVEKLRDYAFKLQNHHFTERFPHNFKIREFEQLAQALDHMVKRLKASAEELETAWEEAKTANQLKSNFLATTSHELRNPLNIMINCVSLVRSGYCDHRAEELEMLAKAEEAAIHLLGIINDLLDIAKIEAGKLSVVMKPIELQQLLKEVINLQAIQIQQKGLQLITSQDFEPVKVQADSAKLKQVLINVISNAVKFTDEGSITITMQLEQNRVIVTVKDTGVGIDPAQQHKLFRPFVMVDSTTTRRFGGTGLGLAISRNLIELMGGNIMLCSSGTNQGTTVAISLPIIENNRSPQSLGAVEPSTNSLDKEEKSGEQNKSKACLIPDTYAVTQPLLS